MLKNKIQTKQILWKKCWHLPRNTTRHTKSQGQSPMHRKQPPPPRSGKTILHQLWLIRKAMAKDLQCSISRIVFSLRLVKQKTTEDIQTANREIPKLRGAFWRGSHVFPVCLMKWCCQSPRHWKCQVIMSDLSPLSYPTPSTSHSGKPRTGLFTDQWGTVFKTKKFLYILKFEFLPFQWFYVLWVFLNSIKVVLFESNT